MDTRQCGICKSDIKEGEKFWHESRNVDRGVWPIDYKFLDICSGCIERWTGIINE